MGIILKNKPSILAPAGTHLARCFRIVDLGTQPDSGFGERRKIVISWELPHERITIDGKEMPMGVSKIYTHSLNKKASLRQDLDRWRGRSFTKEEMTGFALKAILGVACQLTIIHEDDRAKVDSVTSLPKGMEVPPCFNPLVEYSVDDGKNEVYKALPEFLRNWCDDCIEWDPARKEPEAPAEGGAPSDPAEDDVPF